MSAREVAEYTELRATIRQRGSARVWLFFATLAVWGAATIATAALAALPIATLLPLLLLASGFDAMFHLHTGVERIGRYLEVFYDADPDSPGSARSWERTIMAYGRAHPGGQDPLFSIYVFFATVLNFVPVLLAEPVRLEILVVGGVHLLFVGRILVCRRAAARQRATDLARFRRIKDEVTAPVQS